MHNTFTQLNIPTQDIATFMVSVRPKSFQVGRAYNYDKERINLPPPLT